MKPFTLLAGEPGSGKTTYIKRLLHTGTKERTLHAGRDFAALGPDHVVGTTHRLPDGTTVTAIGDFTKDHDLWLAGGDIFYRLNNSARTPWPSFTRLTLHQAIVQVTTALPADRYIYDNWVCSTTLLKQLRDTFALNVILLRTPSEECLVRRVARVEGRARKNGRFKHDRAYLSDPKLKPTLSAAHYLALGIPVQELMG